MNQPKSILSAFLLLVVTAVLTHSAAAQSDTKIQADQDYDITLQVLIGTNEAGPRFDVPQNLSTISKQLKSNFAFSGYRLANTFLGRVSNTGSFDYKSVSDALGQESAGGVPSFLEWSIGGLRGTSAGLQAQSFRFGARVPVMSINARDETGKPMSVYNYESIGLNIARLGTSENVPTLLGSLSLPKTNGTLFLVLTLTPVKR